MSRTAHTLTITVPLPISLPPTSMITKLHDHNCLIKHQALVTSWKEIDGDLSYPDGDDPFFAATDPTNTGVGPSPVKLYDVDERVVIIPGIGEWGKKYITFPARFQNTWNGVKSRADAPAGVAVRAEWTVIGADPAMMEGDGNDKGQDGSIAGDATGGTGKQWVLREDVSVECSMFLMPFVKRSMEGVHRDICQKMIEETYAKADAE